MTGLVASDLERYYGHWKVVDKVTVDVQRGQVVGLLGPNGAGKTTTFYLIVGLLRVDGGRIEVDGKDITRLPMHERARMGIGYLAQEPSIFRRLTVRENILAVLETLKLSSKERAERLAELLETGPANYQTQRTTRQSSAAARFGAALRSLFATSNNRPARIAAR